MSDINSFYPSSTYPTVDEVKKYFENDDYMCKIESVSGSFCRTFAIPAAIDTSSVKASLKDGILKIVLNKNIKNTY